MPHAFEVAEYWASREGCERAGTLLVYDLGEPCCFACGWWPGWLEGDEPEGSLKHIWTGGACGLERCHLTPRAKGGSEHPSNIVLLCPDCHLAAPDCLDPEIMLRWVAAHEPYLIIKQREMLAEAAHAGLDPERSEEWAPLISGVLQRIREEDVTAPGGLGWPTVFGLVAQQLRAAT